MTLEKLIHIKAVAALLMATVGWPILSAVLNLLSRKKTPEQWEAWALSKPMLALGFELMRALGADPKKAMVAFRNYAQRKAGEAPARSPAIQQLVSDPVKAKLLEEAVMVLAETQAQAPQEPPASPKPASSPE
jgi:hypothetical protein